MTPSGRVLFGAAYYHEYQPSPRLETDLDLMRDAHFSVIRVGEATWSSWEPEDGRFDLDWMQPVLDGAHARGIGVVLGTPTFAVPMWLARRYPEIAIRRADGTRTPWGTREEMDYTHPAFRFHAERVIRAVLGRYADHPAVLGYQVHNEPGLHQIYNRGVVEAFRDRLRHRFGTVDALNQAWGLTFWSHRLSDWADLWSPDGNGQPQYDLAWRDFQATITQEHIAWQRDLVAEYRRDDQLITTCLSMDRPAFHEARLAGELDVTAANPYYQMQDDLHVPPLREAEQSWMTSGAWSVALSADRVYGTRQQPFLVFETDAGPIGGPATNYPAYDGQLAQAAWTFVSRGAQMIEYWHWQSLHYGTETYWGGVLPHDQQPGRIYHQVAALGADLERAGAAVVGLTPDHDVTLLYSVASKWGLAFQPHVHGDDLDPHNQRNERAYGSLVEAFYRGAYDAGLQVRIVHDEQVVAPDGRVLAAPAEFAAEHPVLVVAGLYVAGDALLDWLGEYAAAGGHLVLGPRTAVADLDARPRTAVKPAVLSGPAGVRYQEFANLRHPLPLRAEVDWIRPTSRAVDWTDCLLPEGAEVLARLDHPHHGRFAAVTTHPAGAGRITTVGVVPDPGLAADLLGWAAGPRPTWSDAPSVRHTSSVNAVGSRVHFVFNWSWETVPLVPPVPLQDVVTGDLLPAGSAVPLGPWGVRVLLEPAS
ncbi:MAG TPA: beta-galactosidase [Cellulomonas sp.]